MHNRLSMRVKKIIPKVFIFHILFLASCSEIGSKDYQYIETYMQTYIQDIAPVEAKPLLIKATSDSAAYVKAYLYFCIADKYYNIEFRKSGTKAGKPLSFKLLNEKSEDITHSIPFFDKELLEKNIREIAARHEQSNE